MDAVTGKRISGTAHLRQRISKMLSTRLNTRCMRRWFGSQLPDLVDAPLNAATRMALVHATADALGEYEPELRLDRVLFDAVDAQSGAVTITIEGSWVPTGEPVSTAITL